MLDCDVSPDWRGAAAAAATAADFRGTEGGASPIWAAETGKARTGAPSCDQGLPWGPTSAACCSPYGYVAGSLSPPSAAAAAAAAVKGDCPGDCSGNDQAGLVRLPRPLLNSPVTAPAAATAAAAAAATAAATAGPVSGGPLLKGGGLGPSPGCYSPGGVTSSTGCPKVISWGEETGLGAPQSPSRGAPLPVDTSAAAAPAATAAGAHPSLWPLSPSSATTASPPRTSPIPIAAAGAATTVAAAAAAPSPSRARKRLVPSELGCVISCEGLGRSPRGNVQVCHSAAHDAWLVLCCAGVAESRAFSIEQLGYEGAKRVALLYAAQCESSVTLF